MMLFVKAYVSKFTRPMRHNRHSCACMCCVFLHLRDYKCWKVNAETESNEAYYKRLLHDIIHAFVNHTK